MAEEATQEAVTEGGAQGYASDAGIPEDVVKKARAMGHQPLEEFKGDPDKWRPADEFVERGDNMVPILRDRLRRAEAKTQELEESIRGFAEYHSKTEQRAYQQAFKDLQTKQAIAVQNGDGTAFLAVNEEIAQLQRDVNAAPKIKVPKQEAAEDPVFATWKDRNTWYNTDRRLTAYADAVGLELRQANPGQDGETWLRAVRKEVEKAFPDKFENPRRAAASPVEGSSQPASKAGGKSYASMPADAKAACDAFVNKYKANGATREGYVKNFYADQE